MGAVFSGPKPGRKAALVASPELGHGTLVLRAAAVIATSIKDQRLLTRPRALLTRRDGSGKR
ncbi:hypothetical protein FOFC_02462 [Fusarium oxysporum]|nr:hypothetical protein FOFC_18784 [Fusarium oxysporum]KAI8406095.1 hypothetical protein FOFC_13563 [Fusarium oxysporum]KAI8416153.1 hypothetical protein FOFC_02462 [Fusarium oxysporum]